MIEFHYSAEFELPHNPDYYITWITNVVASENKTLGNLSYVFMSDEDLLSINQKHLNHDTYTDIITFDYSESNQISGEIFISIDRIKENATTFGVDFHSELLRVMIHGVLHLVGYKDKTNSDIELMRKKESEKISMFHVEQ